MEAILKAGLNLQYTHPCYLHTQTIYIPYCLLCNDTHDTIPIILYLLQMNNVFFQAILQKTIEITYFLSLQ